MRVLVTGGLGFIGSHFINHCLSNFPEWEIVNLDKAGIGSNPANVLPSPRVKHLIRDIANSASFADLNGFDLVFHFAAESHVDRSLDSALPFISSNVIGTLNVLEFCRKTRVPRLMAISTDEVYGSIETGAAKETDELKPGNPYAASKAGADMLCLAYHNTHGLDVIVTRCGNNYGLNQFEEKLIPKAIKLARAGLPIPVYDQGEQRRTWVYVEDHIADILHLAEHGKAGEIYNVGAGYEASNNDVVKSIVALMDKPESLIRYKENARPGHDWRYSIDLSKLGGSEKSRSYFIEKLTQLVTPVTA